MSHDETAQSGASAADAAPASPQSGAGSSAGANWSKVKAASRFGMLKEAPEVFISYHTASSQDIFTMAQSLLTTRGVTVCDPADFVTFDSKQMRACVGGARVVVVVLSEGLFTSKYCYNELRTALDQSIPILPVFDESQYNFSKTNFDDPKNVMSWKVKEYSNWHPGFKGEDGAKLREYMYTRTVCAAVNHAGQPMIITKVLKSLANIVPTFENRLHTEPSPVKTPSSGPTFFSDVNIEPSSTPTQAAPGAGYEASAGGVTSDHVDASTARRPRSPILSTPSDAGELAAIPDQQRPPSGPQSMGAVPPSSKKKRKKPGSTVRPTFSLVKSWVRVAIDHEDAESKRRLVDPEDAGRRAASAVPMEITAEVLHGDPLEDEKRAAQISAQQLAGWLDEAFALAIQHGVRKAERGGLSPEVRNALQDTTIKTILTAPITRLTMKEDPFGEHGGPFTLHLEHSCTEGAPIFVLTRPDSPLAGWELVNPDQYTAHPHWVEVTGVTHLSLWTVFTLSMEVATRTAAGFGIDAVGCDAIMKTVMDSFAGMTGGHVAAWLLGCHLVLQLVDMYKERQAGAVAGALANPPAIGILVTFYFFRHILTSNPNVVQLRVIGTTNGRPSEFRGQGFTEKYISKIEVTHFCHNTEAILLQVPGQRALTFRVVPTQTEQYSITPPSELLTDPLPALLPTQYGQHDVQTENTGPSGIREPRAHSVVLVP